MISDNWHTLIYVVSVGYNYLDLKCLATIGNHQYDKYMIQWSPTGIFPCANSFTQLLIMHRYFAFLKSALDKKYVFKWNRAFSSAMFILFRGQIAEFKIPPEINNGRSCFRWRIKYNTTPFIISLVFHPTSSKRPSH